MNELTTNMKPVCFGRYLIDVPQKAETALGSAKSDAIRIETIKQPAPSSGAFKNRVFAREAELRAQKHDSEGTRLRESAELPDDLGRTFVYREDAEDTRLAVVETMVWKPSGEWLLRYQTSNRNIPIIKKDSEQVAAAIKSQPDGVPTVVGACFKDSLLQRIPREAEEFAGGARMEDLSWTLSFRSETSKPRDKTGRLIARAEEAVSMAGASSGIKVLRKREVTVDGRSGEEFIALYPGDGVVSLDAKLELYGDGTYRLPTIKLNLEANRLAPPDPNDKRQFLSDEEALALWDAVVKSLRPRPGAF